MKAFHAVWALFGEAKIPVNVQLVVQQRGVSAVKQKNFAHLSVNVRLVPINDSHIQVNNFILCKNVDNMEVAPLIPLFFPQPMLNHDIMIIIIIIYIGTLTLVTHLQYVVKT